jgi:hypothetical protein
VSLAHSEADLDTAAQASAEAFGATA